MKSTTGIFHGPTLAFKGYRRPVHEYLPGLFCKGEDWEITVLVATSGDTGRGGLANGFYDVEGCVQVVILYPSGKVSPCRSSN